MTDQVPIAITIIGGECQDKVKAAQTVEEKLTVAMRAAFDHWMFTDEQIQLMAAIGVVMADYGPGSDEWTRLETEVKSLQALTAMASGVPVDIEVLVNQAKGSKPVGIPKLWQKTKDEK